MNRSRSASQTCIYQRSQQHDHYSSTVPLTCVRSWTFTVWLGFRQENYLVIYENILVWKKITVPFCNLSYKSTYVTTVTWVTMCTWRNFTKLASLKNSLLSCGFTLNTNQPSPASSLGRPLHCWHHFAWLPPFRLLSHPTGFIYILAHIYSATYSMTLTRWLQLMYSGLILQFLWWEEAFPVQMGYIIPPASSGFISWVSSQVDMTGL